MKTQTFLAVFALTTAVAAAPLPNDPSSSSGSSSSGLMGTIENILGSPFGNGNGDGNGNTAGSGDNGNASGNGSGDGNGSGSGNKFGNGNNIGSGNSGISIGRRNGGGSSSSSSSSSACDPLATIENVLGSPFGNGNCDGNGNGAGNNDNGNAAGNGANDGNKSGSGNIFGNGNNIGSGNSGLKIGKKVRDLPSDALDLIPDQTVTSLNQDFGQIFSDGPTDFSGAVEGALSNDDTSNTFNGKKARQVLTGVEDIIADDIISYIP